MVMTVTQHLLYIFRASIAGLGVLVVAVGWTTIGRAETCTDTTDSSIVTTCAAQIHPSRLDDLLTSDPARGRAESRLNEAPWIARTWADAPFTLVPAGSNLTMRTSIHHWGAYANRTLAKRIEEAKSLAPEDLKLPPLPPMGNPSVDLWSTLAVRDLDNETARGFSGAIGADYKVNRNAVVGLALELPDEHALSVSEENYMLTTYFGLRPSVPVTFDAKAAWGETRDLSADQKFTASRGVVSARISGDWRLSNVKIAPMLSIAHAFENVRDSAGGASIQKSAITIAPRISRSFELDKGQELEPFLTYKREIDIDAAYSGAGIDESAGAGLLGAGVSLAKPDAYSLRATTEVEDIGTPETRNVKSRLQLTIPIE